ncbi:unnamed protein product [Rhizophagus irregularis]|nr:unnamed protein product [Rhizophagus irregularis]
MHLDYLDSSPVGIEILYLGNLPDISEQEKDGLFEAFSRSDAFGVIEHSALLDALADPVKGWNLHYLNGLYPFTSQSM